jgi:hypothetical protein
LGCVRVCVCGLCALWRAPPWAPTHSLTRFFAFRSWRIVTCYFNDQQNYERLPSRYSRSTSHQVIQLPIVVGGVCAGKGTWEGLGGGGVGPMVGCPSCGLRRVVFSTSSVRRRVRRTTGPSWAWGTLPSTCSSGACTRGRRDGACGGHGRCRQRGRSRRT